MFDWFWEFLYGISKSIFHIIDGMMACANKLCGIEPIEVNSKDVDFLTYLLTDDKITYAFGVAVLIGIFLVMLFAIFAIIRTVVSEKVNATPMQVFLKAFKTILMFIFVPAVMISLIFILNYLMTYLYQATLGGSSAGIGTYLTGAFGQDACGSNYDFYLDKDFNYLSTGNVKGYINLKDFDYLFSWIAGIAILITLANTLLMFVDRTISIVLLFIVSPISISTNVIDDGARFKLWRDQVLVKFITAYGCIIALNVYIMIISLISSQSVKFFDANYLNNLFKIAFIVGGAVSMQRSMALIGNLVSAGAGSNELRDNAIASAGFKGAVGGTIAGLKKIGSFGASAFRGTVTTGRGIANAVKDWKSEGFGAMAKDRWSRFKKTAYNTIDPFGDAKQKRQADAQERNNKQLAGLIGDKVSAAILGGNGANGSNGGNSSNANNNNVNNKKPGENVANIINNGSSVNKGKDGKK